MGRVPLHCCDRISRRLALNSVQACAQVCLTGESVCAWCRQKDCSGSRGLCEEGVAEGSSSADNDR